MFKACTDQDQVKDYAKKIINKRLDKHIKQITEKEKVLTIDPDGKERDLDPKLRKWRLKDRKHDFTE